MTVRDRTHKVVAACGKALPGLRGVLVVAAVLALISVAGYVPLWLAQIGQAPSWEQGDLDTALIHDGLSAAPAFRDTLRWWIGPWAGTVPFYRPLTSYLFWGEWKLLGNREWLYGLPTGAAHVLATLLFAWLTYRLAERWRIRWPAVAAMLAAGGFTGLGFFYRSEVVFLVGKLWKNQPDSWAASCCFAALLAYLRAQDHRKPVPWAAAAWYLTACCFKELAVPLPLAAVVLEFGVPQAGRRRALSRSGVLLACAGLFLVVRYLALSGSLGYRYGSNDSWLGRTLLELLGPFGAALMVGRWASAAAALYVLLLGGSWWRSREFWRRKGGGWPVAILLLTLALGLAGCTAMSMANLPQGSEAVLSGVAFRFRVVSALLLFTLYSYTQEFLTAAALPFVAWVLWRRSPAILCFSVAWTVIFLAPLTLSPGPIHRYYVSEAGYVLAGALALAEFAALAWQRWGRADTAPAAPHASAIQ